MLKSLTGCMVLLLAALAGADAQSQTPRYNYMLYCVGCHTVEGVSPPLGRIPPLKDVIGYFTRVPAARRYVANVPGIKNSGLNVAETAALANWLVETYAGDSLPQRWERFTAGEIAALREDPPGDVIALRDEAREALAALGFDIGSYP